MPKKKMAEGLLFTTSIERVSLISLPVSFHFPEDDRFATARLPGARHGARQGERFPGKNNINSLFVNRKLFGQRTGER
jgi:hypothetical protein